MRVLPDAGSMLVAFGLTSWLPDCIPVALVLYLLGPENAVRVVLRLLAACNLHLGLLRPEPYWLDPANSTRSVVRPTSL